MMNSPSDDHKSAPDAASAAGANPLWLLVGASALFFALAAALLASG